MLGYYAYQENVQTAKENFTNVLSSTLLQTSGNLASLFADLEKQASLFSNNIVVQDVLTKEGFISPSERYDDYMNLNRLVETFVKQNQFVDVRMLIKQRILFLDDSERYIYSNNLQFEPESQLLFQRDLRTHWIHHPVKNDFSVIVDILSLKGFGERLAFVSFDLDEEAVRNVLNNMGTQGISNLYLIDEKGRNLFSLRNNTEDELSSVVLEQIKQSGSNMYTTQLIEGKGDTLTVHTKLNNFPFFLVALIPMKEIQNRSMEILRKFLWITLLVVAISFVVSYLISAGMTRRIKHLVSAMQTIETSDFTVQVQTDYVDEIGILTRRFNWMVNRIRLLIQTVYKSDMEKKQAELNLLQTQINPHFLYNTLDSINWLAVRHQADDIVFMIQNLSEFMRLSLNSDRKVTVQTEIRHLLAYFNIQKYRFEDYIHLRLEVPRELYAYRMISLILQPLVENALIHGILKEDGREGTITVRGELNEGIIFLEVMDDGVGMSNEKLEQITEHVRQPINGLGQGLRNVHQRICIEYGEEYGLNVLSEPGKGTSCIVVFPAGK